MIFPYQCKKCDASFDLEFPIGKAPRNVGCVKCGGISNRVYQGLCIAVSIDGATCRTSNWGNQQLEKNKKAKQRQGLNTPPVKLAGYQLSNGQVVGPDYCKNKPKR